MTEADVIEALRGHWLENGVLAYETVWDDDPDHPGITPWFRVTIRMAGNVRRTIGRTLEENRGLISVKLMVPKEGGPGQGERLVSDVCNVWRVRLPNVLLSAPSPTTLTPDGAFNRYLITIGWRADIRLPSS